MTSPERLWSLIDGVRFVIQENLAGDFVECGVWRGGSVMAMALELNRLGVSDRNLWLYDTFTGMTEPTDTDVESGTGKRAADLLRTTDVGDGNNIWCVADRTDVEANVTSTGYPTGLMTLVEGDVSETLHRTLPSEVALLRLDTDWYESTKSCMEMLYPKLVPGGVCILDDYGHWAGAVEQWTSTLTNMVRDLSCMSLTTGTSVYKASVTCRTHASVAAIVVLSHRKGVDQRCFERNDVNASHIHRR